MLFRKAPPLRSGSQGPSQGQGASFEPRPFALPARRVSAPPPIAPAAPAPVANAVQRKFTIVSGNDAQELTADAQVEALREQLVPLIQRLTPQHKAEDVLDQLKWMARNTADMGRGSWEQAIHFAAKDLDDEEDPYESSEEEEEEEGMLSSNEEEEEDEEEEEEDDELMDAQPDSMAPSVRLGTFNVEKLGKSTKAANREEKKTTMLHALDYLAPTALAMQEVTNADFLFEGSAKKPGLRDMTVPYYSEEGIQQLKKERLFSKTQREGKLGYKPSDEYQMLKGPSFESGSYRENYPLLINTSQVIGTPTCFTVNLQTGVEQPFDVSNNNNQQPIPFSKVAQVNRHLVVWKLTLNVSPHLLRPQPGRGIPTWELYMGVVHTSPSIDIKNEISLILQYAKQISDRDGVPMAIVGDWYMQRSATDLWQQLQKGQMQPWQLVYPDTKTNFPGKGEGQTADHGIVDSSAFAPTGVFPFLPPQDPFGAIERQDKKPDEQEMEEVYTSMGVDHALVMHDLDLLLDEEEEED